MTKKRSGLAPGTNDSGRRKAAPKFCTNCGDQITSAGRDSKDGTRFCSKPGCRAAKAARARARAAAIRGDRPAPPSCAYCECDLPARQWRAGDELGRCCRKVSCRNKRDRERAEAGIDRIPALFKQIELLENAATLLSEAVMADNEHIISSSRKVCPDCGLTSALSGWAHITELNAACWGTLDGMPVRKLQAFHLALAWPMRREYLSAKDLEEFRA